MVEKIKEEFTPIRQRHAVAVGGAGSLHKGRLQRRLPLWAGHWLKTDCGVLIPMVQKYVSLHRTRLSYKSRCERCFPEFKKAPEIVREQPIPFGNRTKRAVNA